MADRINVCRDGKAIYDIVLTQSFDGLKEAVSCLPVKEHKICIVTDSNVAPLYLEEVRAALSGCCKAVSVFTFPAGEENKHLDTVRNLYEHLILEHFDRKDMLAALGGGVPAALCLDHIHAEPFLHPPLVRLPPAGRLRLWRPVHARAAGGEAFGPARWGG